MDTAVAVVQAYLQVNGYFTVCEYPVLESRRRKTRSATDVDVLAVRFPGAGREVRGRGRRRMTGATLYEPDPALQCSPGSMDMVVGEVKEGRATFNAPARDPLVLAAALARFGCCAPEHAGALVSRLLSDGHAETHHGHTLRLVAFGGRCEPMDRPGHLEIPLEHVVGFLQAYLSENWDTLHAAQLKLPALDLLALMQKCGAGVRDAD